MVVLITLIIKQLHDNKSYQIVSNNFTNFFQLFLFLFFAIAVTIYLMNMFAENLYKFRVEKDLTQRDVAKMLGVSQVCYLKWEKGKTKPNFDMALKICDLFAVPPTELLGYPIKDSYESLSERLTGCHYEFILETFFPARLKHLRELRKMTQQRLATLIGVPTGCIENWETGTHEPLLVYLYRLAHFLEVDFDFLMCVDKETKESVQWTITQNEKRGYIPKEQLATLKNAIIKKKFTGTALKITAFNSQEVKDRLLK